MELPRSLAWEMISQQACGPGAFHRWKVGLDAHVCTCVCLCVFLGLSYACASTQCIFVCELIAQWVAIRGLSQPISLQEKCVAVERSVTHKPHVCHTAVNVTNFREIPAANTKGTKSRPDEEEEEENLVTR